MRRKTVLDLQKMKAENEKIAMITAYDATMARLVDAAGVDMVLVGDSLGMVVQGMEDTLSVTLDDMAYHCLLYTSPSPRDQRGSRMPSSA